MLKIVLHAYENRWYLTSYFRNSSKNATSREVLTMCNKYQRSFNRISLRVHPCSSFHIFAAQQQAHLRHGQSNELPPRSNLGEVVAIPGLPSIQTSHWHQPIYHNLFNSIIFPCSKFRNHYFHGRLMRKITWSPEIQWSWVMRTLLPIWGDGKMCFQSFHKVCMCEVSGTCTPLQLLKISVKIEVMGQIEIKQTFCGHLWGGFSTKSTIFWRGLANSFTTPCPYSHIRCCFYRHISKLLQFEGFNGLSCFG